MFENSYLLNLTARLKELKPETFVFLSTLLFYFLLWFINPSNKIIAVSFLGLIFVFYYRLKNVRLSVLLAYIVSAVIYTGKSYLIQLVPAGFFPKDLYPQGYIVFFIFTSQFVLAAIMALFLARDFVKSRFKTVRIERFDILIIFYFVWLIVSDFFGSARPEVSLLFSLSSVNLLVFYFFLKNYLTTKNRFLPLLYWLFAAQVFFESFVAFQQFIASSPIYKSLEAQVNIELFGRAPDELLFRFRPVGTFEHANVLGMWMGFWEIILFISLFKRQSPTLFAVFLVGLITLVITLSRSSWLGFVLGSLFTLFILEKVKKVKAPEIFTRHLKGLSVIALLLFVFFIFPRAEKSFFTFAGGGGYFRYLQIQDTLAIVLNNPIFGVGTYMSVLKAAAYNPEGIFSYTPLSIHNWYLLRGVEHGVIAVVLFTLILYLFLKSNITSLFRQPIINLSQYIRLGLVGGILALCVVGLFQPFIGETLFILSFAIIGREKNANV